jgi:hypothetical protein
MIALFLRGNFQPSQMFAEGVADQRRAILFREARDPVGCAEERLVEHDLYGFHMWTLFHSILDILMER